MILDLVFPFNIAFREKENKKQLAENHGFRKKHKTSQKHKKRERERKQTNLGFIANLVIVFPPLPRQWRRMVVFVVH
jgi:hypothetical protein